MKYLWIICLLYSNFLVAQNQLIPFLPSAQELQEKEAACKIRTVTNVIWDEDFSTGLSSISDWIMTDATGNGWNFIWTDNPSPVPNGEWMSGATPFASTTVNNGYLCLPSDEYNLPNSPNYLNLSTTAQLPVFNFDTVNPVLLSFQQYFRCCCGGVQQLEVRVSNDSLNWVSFDVVGNASAATGSENPDTVVLNISSVAANEPEVYVQFYFGNASHYFWAIDDIQIFEKEFYDLKMEDYGLNYYTMDGGGNINQHGFYQFLSKYQLMPMLIEADIRNIGTMEQTGITLEGNVLDGNGLSVLNYQNNVSLLAVDSLVNMQGASFNAQETSYYTSIQMVSGDSIDNKPIDNTSEWSWFVTDDCSIARSGYYTDNVGVDDFFGFNDGDFMGVEYSLVYDSEIKSMDVYISSEVSVGDVSIVATLYHKDGSDYVLQAQSDPIVVFETDTASWKELFFNTINSEDDDLLAGESYLFGFETYLGGTGNVLKVGADTEGPHDFQNVSRLRQGTSWYWMNYVPLIRINLLSPCGVDPWSVDEITNDVRIYPNPVKEKLFVQHGNNSTINIYSVFGELIRHIKCMEDELLIDMSDLSSGTYILSIIDKQKSYRQKITVIR